MHSNHGNKTSYSKSTEVWKDIKGYEGTYQISTFGRWRTLTRTVWYNNPRGNGKVPRYVRGQIRKPLIGGNGYLMVVLRKNGDMKIKLIHRVVLETFVGPCPAGMEGCHNDGNHQNNNIQNLRWDTRSNNHYDGIRHGTYPVGEARWNTVLNKKLVQVCRKAHAKGASINKLSAKYKINWQTLADAINRKTWKHVK